MSREVVYRGVLLYIQRIVDFRQIVLGEYKIGTNPDCERKIRGTNRGGGSCFKKITRSVSKVIVHENYDFNATIGTNDIALIR